MKLSTEVQAGRYDTFSIRAGSGCRIYESHDAKIVMAATLKTDETFFECIPEGKFCIAF